MNKTAQTLIIIAAACWGLIGVCARPLGAAGFSYAEVAAVRCLIASVGLFSFLLITDRQKLKIKPRDIPVFICMGGVGISLGFICYFYTLEKTTLAVAAILLYTAPYFVMIMSALFFQEKITSGKIIALLIAFAGCAMTIGFFDRDDISVVGVGAGLISAFCYSLFTIVGKEATRRYDPFTVTVYTYGMACVTLLPFCDFRNMVSLFSESSVNLMIFLFLGVFITLIPSVCYMKGLEKSEPGRVSILAFFEPLTASIAGIVVFNELLSPQKMTGIALILLSVIILNKKPAPH